MKLLGKHNLLDEPLSPRFLKGLGDTLGGGRSGLWNRYDNVNGREFGRSQN